jgi:hypothetical protein
MITINKTWQKTHRAMIYQATGGMQVKFQRVTGIAPNATVNPVGGASVTAIVRGYSDNGAAAAATGYGSNKLGGITEGERQILVMADELAAAGFPLPLQKNDQVIVIETGELMTVTKPDSTKRAVAGCIEAYAVGVQ